MKNKKIKFSFLNKIGTMLEMLPHKLRYPYLRSKYNLPSSFRFNGPGIKFYGEGKIIIGENSYVGSYSSFQAVKGQKIIIGRNTAISHHVAIYTANRVANQNFGNKKIKVKEGNVIVGNNCWICYGVFLKEGVKIGDNVVIGANSVVTKDIPSYEVWGGGACRIH